MDPNRPADALPFDDFESAYDGPVSPIGNGDYIDLAAIQSHGEPAKKFTFQILDKLTPPTDPNQTEETHG